jgi:diguanylate cyclase (GGDEF)-like protein
LPGRWLVTPARPPAVPVAVIGVLAIAWTAFLASTLLRPGPGFRFVWDAGVYDGITLTAALLVLARAITVRAERWAWVALGAGLLCNAVGDFTYSALAVRNGEVPIPSVADVFFLAFYPCLYIALVLLLRVRIRRLPVSGWLDGLVTASALTALVAALAFARIEADTGGSQTAIAVGLAYPLGDLVLLGSTAGALAAVGWRADARWWLLSIGLVLFGCIDTIYLFQSAAGTYQDGTWIDTLWPAAAIVLAVTSWLPSRSLTSEPLAGRAALMPPVVCTIAALTVLCVAAGPRVPRLAVALAALTMLGATARFSLSFAEVAALADSRRQALTDDLTGLANRRRLLQALVEAGKPSTGLGLLLVDLDRFKEVNDSLGHHVGDELLVQLAGRLRSVTRGRDLVARLGGDEFAVLLTGRRDSSQQEAEPVTLATAEAAARRIAQALDAPFPLDDVTLHVQASIGIALLPEHTDDPVRLLQRADVAMYSGKTSGARLGVYRPQDDPHSRERLQLLEELRHSLAHGGLTCHYQPKVVLATGDVEGVEALCRWQHLTRGLLMPDAFLSLAEHAGLMRELTACVLDEALGQVRRWREEGLNLCVAVNLSATNLLDADLPDQIGRLLISHGVPAAQLQVEITETVMMADSTRSREVLHRLHRMGVRASIDDYGTGYSSLAYLKHLTVDELKLDRSFVAELTTDPRAAAIVRSTVDLAHSLGLRLVAEGVEDAETLDALREYGCDVAQGYHHSRPMAADDVTRWLRARHDERQEVVPASFRT